MSIIRFRDFLEKSDTLPRFASFCFSVLPCFSLGVRFTFKYDAPNTASICVSLWTVDKNSFDLDVRTYLSQILIHPSSFFNKGFETNSSKLQ